MSLVLSIGPEGRRLCPVQQGAWPSGWRPSCTLGRGWGRHELTPSQPLPLIPTQAPGCHNATQTGLSTSLSCAAEQLPAGGGGEQGLGVPPSPLKWGTMSPEAHPDLAGEVGWRVASHQGVPHCRRPWPPPLPFLGFAEPHCPPPVPRLSPWPAHPSVAQAWPRRQSLWIPAVGQPDPTVQACLPQPHPAPKGRVWARSTQFGRACAVGLSSVA